MHRLCHRARTDKHDITLEYKPALNNRGNDRGNSMNHFSTNITWTASLLCYTDIALHDQTRAVEFIRPLAIPSLTNISQKTSPKETLHTTTMTDPTPTTPLILLTGSTGFIGSRILSDLLSANHRVRASVRRPEQIPLLTSRHSSPAESGQLQFAVIPSLDDTAAVRVAISNDVTCVIHLASPMPGKGEDFESDYLKPAVKGTETVLEAARGTRVGRVVVMSSVLAMVPLGGLEMEGLHVEGRYFFFFFPLFSFSCPLPSAICPLPCSLSPQQFSSLTSFRSLPSFH